MKLDAQAEAHKISAHQYDKLQSMCEFSSGFYLMFAATKREEKEKETEDELDLKQKIKDIETKIKEIKTSNRFIFLKSSIKSFTIYIFNSLYQKVYKL